MQSSLSSASRTSVTRSSAISRKSIITASRRSMRPRPAHENRYASRSLASSIDSGCGSVSCCSGPVQLLRSFSRGACPLTFTTVRRVRASPAGSPPMPGSHESRSSDSTVRPKPSPVSPELSGCTCTVSVHTRLWARVKYSSTRAVALASVSTTSSGAPAAGAWPNTAAVSHSPSRQVDPNRRRRWDRADSTAVAADYSGTDRARTRRACVTMCRPV